MSGYCDGDYWRVRVNLATLATSATDLVIPRAFHAGPLNSGGQYAPWRDYQLILTGFCYVFSAAASGAGFDIIFSDRNTSPAVNTTEWSARTAAAGTVVGHHDDLKWLLPKSAPGSPVASGQIGGVIRALRVGTIAAGTLQLWGYHTQEGKGDKAYGSPVTFA